MKTFSNYVSEVAEPLSQGEKNFKSMHGSLVASNRNIVPGVTDQDHVFKGTTQKKDQLKAGYHSGDEAKAAYDNTLKTEETEEDLDEGQQHRVAYNRAMDHYSKAKMQLKTAKTPQENSRATSRLSFLRSHINYMRKMMMQNEPMRKKTDGSSTMKSSKGPSYSTYLQSRGITPQKSVKMRKEDFEQIDEISKKTAMSAYQSASFVDSEHPKQDAIRGHIEKKWGKEMGKHADAHAHVSNYGRGDNFSKDDKLSGYPNKKASDMRMTKSGKINKQDTKAKASLIKSRLGSHTKPNLPEEVEQVDELSRKTLGSYVNKATVKYGMHTLEVGQRLGQGKGDSVLTPAKKAAKKVVGIHRATERLTREEVEDLDEKITASTPTSKVISDFVHSKNPKFKGKSAKERIRMALGASYAMKKEEVEQVDEKLTPEAKKNIKTALGPFKQKDSSQVRTMISIAKSNPKNIAKEEVELDEAKRGRPRKDGTSKPASGEEEGGREHIVVQLRKAENLRGDKHVEFNDSTKHKLPLGHVKKALNMHSSMKPIPKGEFEARLAKSHQSFMDAVSGKPADKPKPKISLASMKKESADFTTPRSDRGDVSPIVRMGPDGRLEIIKRQKARKEIKIGDTI